ncbi:hypothetical protein KY338_02810 [Candidatus Woesearchaeota archaeon]|nr:hypothetical protein [Candidatus Woesearchaeota archaeon]MBW3005711.1 hypothetical protein [Candidatus Woesearchaeota archaeon]
MFKFLKKKKEEKAEEDFELPPPPAPPADLTAPSAPEEEEASVEIPDIKPKLEFPELEKDRMPEFPELPSEEHYVEDVHEAEMPRLPEHPTLAEPEFPEIKPEMTPRRIFDRTIQEAVEKPEEIIRHEEIKPMFVAVEDFKNLASNTNFVRSKLVEAEEYLQRLTDLKNQELKAFEKWKKTLESVESKLSYVDKVIAEAQG